MLDIKFIREHSDEVKHAVLNRNVVIDIDYVIQTDEKRRRQIQIVDELRAKQNEISERISTLAGEEKDALIQESKTIKIRLSDLEFELKAIEEEFLSLMYKIPNMPDADVPVGKDEHDNVVLREAGDRHEFSFSPNSPSADGRRKAFSPRDYVEIGEKLDLIDTARAAKVSGSRFGYLKHEAPLLEFALVQMVFSRLSDTKWIDGVVKKSNLPVSAKPFIPLVPPVMIRPDVFRAMGKLDPGQEEDRYYLPKDDLYLIGSGEHTTGAMHMDEVLDEEKLPHRHIAFSTCFRREAGSYGKDTRGILRVHQFDKLEMFSFAHPDDSNIEHEFFLAVQESLMRELNLPYRVLLISTGDMCWTDAKQYDIETWLPGQNNGKGEYRETHSTSNSRDFQSRRLQTKFRDANGKIHLLHTINGTAFAIGRTLIAILENYQQEDGSVRIPDVLQSYMGGIKEIRR